MTDLTQLIVPERHKTPEPFPSASCRIIRVSLEGSECNVYKSIVVSTNTLPLPFQMIIRCTQGNGKSVDMNFKGNQWVWTYREINGCRHRGKSMGVDF